MEYFHAHNKDKHPYADTFVTDKQVRKVRVRGYVCYRSSEGIRHDFYMLQLDNKSNRMCHKWQTLIQATELCDCKS